MIIVKSAAELEKMRAGGRIAAEVRESVVRMVAPGITTGELAEYAGQLIRGFGAESAFLGYMGFPGEICVSVNDVVVHGIPGSERIRRGDIVGLDLGVRYDGFVTDTAVTVMVGVEDEAVIRLVRTAELAFDAGMAMATAGRRLSDVSHAIEETVKRARFSVVREFVGHGIGASMHEDPQIPNFGAAGRGPLLKAGMVLALEPMVNQGSAAVRVDPDGWTVRTRDRKYSAHFEHTVAVTDGVAEVITARAGGGKKV